MSNDNQFGDFESNYNLEDGHVSKGDKFDIQFYVEEEAQLPVQRKFTTYEVEHEIAEDNEEFDGDALLKRYTGLDPEAVLWKWAAQISFESKPSSDNGPVSGKAKK